MTVAPRWEVDGQPQHGRFERRLRRRHPFLGEVSEGAVEAPSDESGMGEHVVMIYGRDGG